MSFLERDLSKKKTQEGTQTLQRRFFSKIQQRKNPKENGVEKLFFILQRGILLNQCITKQLQSIFAMYPE